MPSLSNQLFAGLVQAHQHFLVFIAAVIDRQHVFHSLPRTGYGGAHKFGATLRRQAPALFPPGFQLVFFNVRRTVSSLMLSTISPSTSPSASSCNVPTDSSLRRRRAGQGNQVGLTLTIQLLPAPVQLLFATQGGRHSLLHAAAAYPFHRGGAHLQGPGDLLVHHWPLGLILIAQQQDAGVSLLISRPPAPGNQCLQFLLFLYRQFYPVLLHHNLPHHFPICSCFYLTFTSYHPSLQWW